MRNVGEKQSLTRFAAGSGSQVQRASPRYRFGERRSNIPRFAFRNPHSFDSRPG